MRPGEPVLLTSHRADRARQIAAVLAETQPLYAILDLGSIDGTAIPVQHVFFPQPPRTRSCRKPLRGSAKRPPRSGPRTT